MSSAAVCQRCGCAEIDEDPGQGNAVCTNCGLVLEESKIVSEISFQETGSGGHALIGQFVSSDGPQRSGIGGPQGYVVKESREVTLNNGRRRIQEVASQLRMNQHCMDTAFNFFKMAVARGLTRGRRSTHVVAACLYLSSRVNNTPHMLLDFSDVLQVNIFELGRVFSFLARTLYINPPPTDPCVYVMRFAQCLQFNEKEHEVCELALRLVRRMKRDWIAFGRRPTGLCGAALLLAARYHNFHRTIADIVRVVNVGEGALRKRLEEFSLTPSGALTLDDFLSVDLESSQDPPSFQESRINKIKKQQEKQELESKAESLQDNLIEMEKEVESALEASKSNNPRFKNGLKMSSSPLKSVRIATETEDPELRQCDEFFQEEVMKVATDKMQDDVHSTNLSLAEKMASYRPTLQSLGIKGGTSQNSEQNSDDSIENNGELDLSGINDEELDGYLLSEPEVKMKTRIWMKNNWKHLREVEEKARIRRELEEEELRDPCKRPKKTGKKRKPPIHAATAGEAISLVVQEKKLSNKIDYEVLRSLTTPSPSPGSTPETSSQQSSGSSLDESSKKKMSTVPTRTRTTLAGGGASRRRIAKPTVRLPNQRTPSETKIEFVEKTEVGECNEEHISKQTIVKIAIS